MLSTTTARVMALEIIGISRAAAVLTAVPLPTTPSEKNEEVGPLQPRHAIWSPLIFVQSQTVFLRNVPNGH
jgi:hypothetical protein